MEVELIGKPKSFKEKSSTEKMLLTSMGHLIKHYGYIVLPVGLLTEAQWYFFQEEYECILLNIDNVRYYRVKEYEKEID